MRSTGYINLVTACTSCWHLMAVSTFTGTGGLLITRRLSWTRFLALALMRRDQVSKAKLSGTTNQEGVHKSAMRANMILSYSTRNRHNTVSTGRELAKGEANINATTCASK